MPILPGKDQRLSKTHSAGVVTTVAYSACNRATLLRKQCLLSRHYNANDSSLGWGVSEHLPLRRSPMTGFLFFPLPLVDPFHLLDLQLVCTLQGLKRRACCMVCTGAAHMGHPT